MLATLARVPPAGILATVFLLPALESSTLLGVLVPAETAILLAGVLAWYGRVPLPDVLAAAAMGAILGDSIGYGVGWRWGRRIVEGRIGRLIGEARWTAARHRLNSKGLLTIILGRFPPAARTLLPLIAGTARMPYRRFLAGNAIGGVAWASASTMAGYLAGDAWRRIEHVQHIFGLAFIALIAALLAVLKLHGRWERAR